MISVTTSIVFVFLVVGFCTVLVLSGMAHTWMRIRTHRPFQYGAIKDKVSRIKTTEPSLLFDRMNDSVSKNTDGKCLFLFQ